MAGITKQKSIATESINHEKTTVCNERPLPSLMKELRVKFKDSTSDYMEKDENESWLGMGDNNTLEMVVWLVAWLEYSKEGIGWS